MYILYFVEVEMSFLNYALDRMVDGDNLLVKLTKLVNWVELSELLNKALGKAQVLNVIRN